MEETMSVELAIERELAYRRKLALQLGSHHDVLKHLLPLQAQSSIQSPTGLPLTTWETKRKQPSSGFERHQVVVASSAKNSSNLFENKSEPLSHDVPAVITNTNLRCNLCGVLCSGQLNLEQHLSGQKHQAKLQEFAKGQHRWCQVCQIPCSDDNALKMHLEGKKHKAKLVEQLRASSLVSASAREMALPEPLHRYYCKQCRISCVDESSLKQHLHGRKHRLQVKHAK